MFKRLESNRISFKFALHTNSMMDFNTQLLVIKQVMKEYSISQSKMAKKIGMKESTFKLKYSDTQDRYKFKPSEIVSMINVMDELKEKIESSLKVA